MQLFEFTPTLVILKNSTLAKVITDAGGSEEMKMCDSVSVFRVQANVPASSPTSVSVPRTRQFNDTLLADVHFWNYRGREVLV